MTESDLKVYKFIVQYIKDNGYAPTYREIANGINLTLSTVVAHINHLEIDGWITTKPYAPRAIKVIEYEFIETERKC